MKHALVAAFLVIAALTAHTQASTPIPFVDVCQLTRNPALYIGKQVEIHGFVTQAFEDFSVHDEQCPAFNNRVALEYGDMNENVKYWKRLFHVQLPETNFLHDGEAERFNNLLREFRIFAPNGNECGPEVCSFFRVSATVTGWFLAMKKTNVSCIGSCRVLVIEHVSDVSATRTEVPFGGVYQCVEDEWRPTGAERGALAGLDSQQTATRDARAARLQMFSRIAQHWDDPAIAGGHLEIASGGWESGDLLRRYAVQSFGTGEELIVTRQLCHATDVPPKEVSPDVRCTQKYWESPSASRTSPQPNAETQLASVARDAISQATASWGTPLSDLLVNTCNHAISGNEDYGQCSFTNQDGTVSMWVELLRMQKRNRKAQYGSTAIPWTITRLRGSFCSQ